MDILIVTNPEDFYSFYQLLGTGKSFGVQLSYTFQTTAGGIADAVYLAKDFVNGDKLIVLLGDNIFKESLVDHIETFKEQDSGAKVLLKEVSDPRRYGVARIDEKKQTIISIDEKPENPPSHYCVVGVYMYDSQIFDFIEQITPSRRGELEITDVNNLYCSKAQLTYEILKDWWIDAGTHEALYQANSFIFQEKHD